jgi:hypothetical protein
MALWTVQALVALAFLGRVRKLLGSPAMIALFETVGVVSGSAT